MTPQSYETLYIQNINIKNLHNKISVSKTKLPYFLPRKKPAMQNARFWLQGFAEFMKF